MSLATIKENSKAPEYSQAGYWGVENSGREVFNFNIGWRFLKGSAVDAHKVDFDDGEWSVVNCPHGLEYIPEKASGSNNYQGEAWYRKRFKADFALKGKVTKLYFEAVMGKCKVWLNGEPVAEHFGGYLPFLVDVTGKLLHDADNVIAVWADNSDDPVYPPGKEQTQLDFAYFGGIYRDVWLLTTNQTYVTDPNEADKVMGGGIFAHTESLSEERAAITVLVDIRNEKKETASGSAALVLLDPEGKQVANADISYAIQADGSEQLKQTLDVLNPRMWSPWSPDLYRLEILLKDEKGNPVDGVATHVGIRKIEFKGKEGFFLNDKPYPGKLMGANRHQDHAVVGNAMSNNAQWRDVVLLKNAGCDIIRLAHYPADPSFMEACDAVGMFCIVPTPGWQFWSEDPLFEKRVYQDIRDMVRRDRNHASVIMWEPILNETHYPDYFAQKVHEIVHEEYPFQGAYTACDSSAHGEEHFDVIYSQPYTDFFVKHRKDTPENRKLARIDYEKENRSIFTREWGDCVEDWNAQNSPSRVARNWGEAAQLVQCKHYSSPDYLFPGWETFPDTPIQHVGGTLWHGFDHQRGYHPDPFYGGLTDIFRQRKYSYYLFASQRDVSPDNEPMVYIAHEMSPVSSRDVTVFSNCEEVRLTVFEGDTFVQKAKELGQSMRHPVMVFKEAFHFMDLKELVRDEKYEQVSLIAEGLIGGKVVATCKKMPTLRPAKLKVELDDNNVPLIADGSDFVRVIVSLIDDNGNTKRLDDSSVSIEVSGEGTVIGDKSVYANPRKLEWGTAPVLIRSTLKAGEIKVTASLAHAGKMCPLAGELTFSSLPSGDRFLYSEEGVPEENVVTKSEEEISKDILLGKVATLERQINEMKLKEVERQQRDFEGLETQAKQG